jgi:hypothetical protein
MTSTFNGFGTRLCGKRNLTYEEYTEHRDHLPYDFNDVVYKIATEAFVALFIPIVPLNTIIYVDVKEAYDKNTKRRTEVLDNSSLNMTDLQIWSTRKYQICSTYHVNWNHVRHSLSFYIFPLLVLLFLLNSLLR